MVLGRLLRHNGQRYLRGSGWPQARGLGAWAARGGTRPGGWELGTRPEGGASAVLVVMDLGCVRRRVLRQLKSCNAKTLLNLEWVQKRLPKLKTGVAIIQTRAHVLFGLFLNPRRHKTLVLVWFAGEIPGMYRLAGTAGSNGEPRPVAAVRSQISVLAVRVLSTGRQPGGCNSTLHFG